MGAGHAQAIYAALFDGYNLTIDRLQQILDDWRHWMHRHDLRDIGYQTSKCFVSGGESTSEKFNEMVAESDLLNIYAIDTMIQHDLNPDHRKAIHYRYELTRTRPTGYIHHLNGAIDELVRIAIKKDLT